MAQYFNSDESSENRECKSDIIVKGGVDFPADPDKRRNQGIRHMAFGFGLAALSFCVAHAVLYTFEIGWLLKALMALTFSVLVIKAYDKATGEQPTPLNGPIAHFTIIFFALCLFTGYQNAHGKSAGVLFDFIFSAKLNESALVEEKEDKQASSSESGTVKTVGDIWFTGHVFAQGDKVKIEVEYNAVQMTGGRILEPGIHDEVLDGNGQIMFEGITTNPSKITITY